MRVDDDDGAFYVCFKEALLRFANLLAELPL